MKRKILEFVCIDKKMNEAYTFYFAVNKRCIDPESVVRQVAYSYFQTQEGRDFAIKRHGQVSWVDLISCIPDEQWKAHGLDRLDMTPSDFQAYEDHRENVAQSFLDDLGWKDGLDVTGRA